MSIELAVYTKAGKSKEKVQVSDKIFGAPIRQSLMHLAVTAHLAKGREGTASAKTRAEVSGGGRKPWKQKGTGSARAGSIRSPLWRGGGVIFPPKPRSYGKDSSQREKKESLKSALSAKVADVLLLEDFSLEKPSTKAMKQLWDQLGISSVLLVTAKTEPILEKSVANLKSVKSMPVTRLNTYDVLKYEKIVLMKSALPELEKYCS